MFRVSDGRRISPKVPKPPGSPEPELGYDAPVSGPGLSGPEDRTVGSDAMTVSAYILIQTEVGKASGVVAAVRELPGVVQADDVTGPYDVILRAEAASIDELGRMVVSQIQLVDGITRTLTCPVVHL
jgi:DNA-binding Lrp family transcriptional regulator